ncbi:MAG: hypothetical protein L0H22_08435, partial [Brevibacterium aurantiacum]|nr:hypothetical protein [Brevibacterium aurantiacum]
MKHQRMVAAAALAGATSLAGFAVPAHADGGATASKPHRVYLKMQTSSPKLASCFPHARARVTVDLTTAKRGFDTVRIQAHGLQPNTQFTAFFLEKAAAPFGAAEYYGDFDTNSHGNGWAEFKLIAEEAFAFNNITHQRIDLNSVGFWFDDEKADDACLG